MLLNCKLLSRKMCRTALLALMLPFTAANADVVIHGTRVIYPSDAREITVKVTNEGTSPALVQAWIDEGDAKITPDQSKSPFVITPPITRVEPGKGQSLRVSALPGVNSLSKTQESLFWLNVLDIPPKPTKKDADSGSDNFLQLAIRSRLKFFYRPAGLKGDSLSAPKQLQWSVQGNTLTIKNPTPYHVTITSIVQKPVGAATDKVEVLTDGMMLAPFSEQKINVKNPNLKGMTFTTINDYGGRVQQTVE